MHNRVLLFGMLFETCLCFFLCYTPGMDTFLGTRPIAWIHWWVVGNTDGWWVKEGGK